MRGVLQRVIRAAVLVDGETIAEIGHGLVVLVGVGHGDGERQAVQLADKVVNLRVFADDGGKFNLSARDVAAEVLVVSQFTLYGQTRKGRRPSFGAAAPPDLAAPLVERFATAIRDNGLSVATGRFGAHMLLEILNDGPVTLLVEIE